MLDSGIHLGDLNGGIYLGFPLHDWPALKVRLFTAPTFEQIQPKIKAILQDKIVVGHTIFNDLAVNDLIISLKLILDATIPITQFILLTDYPTSTPMSNLTILPPPSTFKHPSRRRLSKFIEIGCKGSWSWHTETRSLSSQSHLLFVPFHREQSTTYQYDSLRRWRMRELLWLSSWLFERNIKRLWREEKKWFREYQRE